MNLYEEYKLYETMWDDTGRKKKATTKKPISEAVMAEYDEREVKACLNRVNRAASTEQPSIDDDFSDGTVFVSVSEELLKKALKIGNRGTFQDGATQVTTVPAHAVDQMVLCFNFYEDKEIYAIDSETATVCLMLGGDDETYYNDLCIVGWGNHIAGLSEVKDKEAAKTFFETQLVPNANKIAEEIINDSWAHYQLSDYAGITTDTDYVLHNSYKGIKGKNDLKEEADYRVVLADYDTDDFDINVDFGMQDPDENEVIDYEYLLKPGQTKGDLVVWLSRDCGYTSIYVHDERPATDIDIKRLASDTFSVTGTGDEWQDYGDLDESLTEEVVDHSGSPGIGLSRETVIHDLLQGAAVRKGRKIGTGEEELYSWLKKEDYYRVEFSAWKQSTAYSFKDFPQHLRDSSTSISEREGIECFVGTLPEVTEVLNDVVAKGYEFELITVSKLLITPPQKKYGFIDIDENTDEVFLLSFYDSWGAGQKEYQAPTIRYNKIFDDHEPFIQAIKNAQGYGTIAEATDLRAKKIVAEARAAKYEILYSDRHTEIVDEDTMNQLVDELESFTRDDVLQIHRISSTGKLGKTIWTEEEGLL